MTESETDAYFIIKKKKIKGASSLAKEMGISRQYAHTLVESLKAKNLITFQPARLLIK